MSSVYSSTLLNSLNYRVIEGRRIIGQYLKLFGWVELPRTHEKISYNLSFLNYSVVRAFRLDGTTLNS